MNHVLKQEACSTVAAYVDFEKKHGSEKEIKHIIVVCKTCCFHRHAQNDAFHPQYLLTRPSNTHTFNTNTHGRPTPTHTPPTHTLPPNVVTPFSFHCQSVALQNFNSTSLPQCNTSLPHFTNAHNTTPPSAAPPLPDTSRHDHVMITRILLKEGEKRRDAHNTPEQKHTSTQPIFAMTPNDTPAHICHTT